jgi:hypothetical protein
MNLQLIRSKADFIGTLNPKAWDAVHPHIQFRFSNAHVELMVADVVKHVGATLADKALSKKTAELSKQMAGQASSAMSASWEPGDDICPPWPWPWPGPWPWSVVTGPTPEPWKAVTSAEQIELAHVLVHLSGLTTSADFNTALKSLATSIAKGAASQLADDFERCGTVPRKPFPPRP